MKKMLSWIVVIFVLVAFWLLFRIKEPAKSPPHAPATVDNQKTEEQRALTGPPLLSPDSNLPPENMGWHVSVHGIVIDDSERPVNAADIWLFRELQGSMVQRLKTKSGQSGTFKIVVDNPGVWNLKARKQKHGFVQRLYSDRPEETGRIIINEDVKDLGPIILRLEKLRTLDVFVTDQATGSPIERASIGFYGMSFDPPRTNSEGHTQIHMPNGKWNLSSWAPGYSYQNNEVDFTKDPIKPLHIQLKPGGLIYGYVTNLDGQPLPGAQIHIKHHSLGRISEVLITDEKGYYEYTSAPLGTPFSLYVYLRGYERFMIRPIKIDPELRSLKWNFTLKPEGAGSPQDQFQFKIEDEKGESIYGATVGAIGFGRHIPKVTELGKGHFRISQMNKGRYSVKINHRDYINLEKRVRAKTSDSQPEIWVMRSGYSITGKVVDQENQPIANASIVFGSIKSGRGDLETDKNGFFKVNGLESEEIYFKVSHELYSKALVNFKAPAEDITIVMPPTSTLEGQVLDAVSSQPIPSFEARVIVKDQTSNMDVAGMSQWRSFDHSDGLFSWVSLSAKSSIILEVRASGYLNHQVQIDIEPGTNPFKVLLKPGNRRIRGILIDAKGRVWPGVNVFAESGLKIGGILELKWMNLAMGVFGIEAIGQHIHTLSDQNGRFEIELPYDSNVDIGVSGGGVATYVWHRVERNFDLSQPLHLRVQAASRIHGLCNLEKWPLARIVDVSTLDKKYHVQAPVMDDGSFNFEGLPAGEWILSWREVSRNHRTGKERDGIMVNLNPGAEQRALLGFDSERVIDGQVFAGGMLAAGSTVFLLEGSGAPNLRVISQKTADAEGQVRFDDLFDRIYTLAIFLGNDHRSPHSHPNRITVDLRDKSWRGRLDFQRFTSVFGRFNGEDTLGLRRVGQWEFRGLSGKDSHYVDLRTGRFLFGDTPPGAYELRAKYRSGERPISIRFTVNEGQTEIDLGNIDPDPMGSLRVSFTSPIPGNFFIIVSGNHINPNITTKGNMVGVTHLYNIPEGVITVYAVSQRGNSWISEQAIVDLQAGQNLDVLLHIRESTALFFYNPRQNDPFKSLRITGPGPLIEVTPDTTLLPPFLIFNGNYGSVRDLNPGTWNIAVTHQSGHISEGFTHLQKGQSNRLSLD